MRKGPLLVYGDDSANIKQAARNLPGVDSCNVNRLNVLQLAPGGHLEDSLFSPKMLSKL